MSSITNLKFALKDAKLSIKSIKYPYNQSFKTIDRFALNESNLLKIHLTYNSSF